MSMRMACRLVSLLLPCLLCASPPVRQHFVSLNDLPSPAGHYKLDDSGALYEAGADVARRHVIGVLPRDVTKQRPRLLGVCDFDGDGRDEIFVTWHFWQAPEVDPSNKAEVIVTFEEPELINVVRIYHATGGAALEQVSEFHVAGRLYCMYFSKAMTSRDANRVFLAFIGGAKWSLYYALRSDGKSVFPLTERTEDLTKEPGGGDCRLDDLDGDGIREWILLGWGGDYDRCGSHRLGSLLEVFRPASDSVRRIWPRKRRARSATVTEAPMTRPAGASREDHPAENLILRNHLCDIDDDGRDEILVLSDDPSAQGPIRTLSMVRLPAASDSFTTTASIQFLSGAIPIEIDGVRRLGDRKQIILRFADPARCGKDALRCSPGAITGGGVDYQDAKLRVSWMNDKLDMQVVSSIEDVDGDGEDEVIFTPGRPGGCPGPPALTRPLLLKGIRTFIPLAPPR